MVNFENLVFRELLSEAPTVSAAPNTGIAKEHWEEALRKAAQSLQSVWKSKYENDGSPTFPQGKELERIITIVSKEASRSSGYAEFGEDFVKKYFPAIELAGRLKDASLAKTTDFSPIVAQFQKEMNSVGSGAPTEFTPSSKLGISLITQFNKKIASTNIGNIALDKDPYPLKSIWFVIMTLLAARKIYRSKKVDLTKVPSSEGFVKDLIINFEKYAGGTVKIPREFESLYGDNVTPKELVIIGKRASDYMETEADRLGITLDPSKTKQALEAFLKNSSLTKESLTFEETFKQILQELYTDKQAAEEIDKEMGDVPQEQPQQEEAPPKIQTFDWTPYLAQKKAEVKKESITNSYNFDTVFEHALLRETYDILSEAKKANRATVVDDKGTKWTWTGVKNGWAYKINGVPTYATPEQQEQFNKQWDETKARGSNKQADPETSTEEATEPEASETSSDETDPKTLPLPGGYILKNIKEQSPQTNSKAKPLYDSLAELANYIRKQQQINVQGAIDAAASTGRALLGGNRMGG
jgi:hypothetical protein